MGLTELHRRKFSKNIAVLGLVVGFCALIWGITMVRIGNNKAANPPPAAAAPAQQTALPAPAPAVE